MKIRLSYLTFSLIFLSACLSCNKGPAEEEKPLSKEMISLSYEEALYVDDFFPELAKSSSIKYSEEMGYYIPFEEKEWMQSYSCGPTYIPSQSTSFTAKATRVEDEDFSGWYANDVSCTILKDIHLPEGVSILYMGSCSSEFKLHISLGENVPYRKLTLEDLSVSFPSWFRASLVDEVYGSIPELEVTAEGVDVSCQLISVLPIDDLDSVQFVDQEGRLCYSVETSFSTLVSVSPEDAIVQVSDPPSELDLSCTFEFEQIDFTGCSFLFEDLSFSPEVLGWDAVKLPSFLRDSKSGIALPQPRILLEYTSDFPFDSSHAEVIALSGENQAAFPVSDNATYMFLPREDGIYREQILNREVEALGNLFKTPFPDGNLQPSLSLRPAMDNTGAVVPGQEYRMHLKTSLAVPLAFTGQIDVKSIQTPTLYLNGTSLGAPGNSGHTIRQIIGSRLPFDCEITPVFTVEGEKPQYLDTFVLNKMNSPKEFTLVYTPSKDQWQAKLYYVVTPVEGSDGFLMKTDYLYVKDSEFWPNNPGR